MKKIIRQEFKSKPHICGKRYNLNPVIAILLPFKQLYVELLIDEFPEQREAYLINEYFDKFGEVSPLMPMEAIQSSNK